MHTPTKEDFDTVYSFLGNMLVEDTSYSKSTILGWFHNRNPKIEITDSYVFFSATTKEGKLNWCPLTKEKEGLYTAIKELESKGFTTFLNANEWQKEVFTSLGYEVSERRDFFEYLYSPQDLIELKGKKFHSKRNFINGFSYPYEFRTYLPSDREALNELLFKWSYLHIDKEVEFNEKEGWHKTEIKNVILSDPEIQALNCVLDDLDGFNCFADVLVIEEKIVGFALGEIMPNGIGAIYFEKADVEYKGIYPLLDNAFCKKHFSGGVVKYINKQEDMGLEGLRKSKLSYNPVKFAVRYTAKKV